MNWEVIGEIGVVLMLIAVILLCIGAPMALLSVAFGGIQL